MICVCFLAHTSEFGCEWILCLDASVGLWMCVCVFESARHELGTNPIVAAAVACVLEHPGYRNDRPQQTAGRTALSLIQS